MNKFLLLSLILLTLCVYQGRSESSTTPTQDTHLVSNQIPSNGTAVDNAPAKRMRGIKRKRTKLPHRARAEDSDDADDSVQSAKAKTGNSGKVKQDHHSESRGFMATISKIGKNLGYMVSNFLTGQYFEVFWNFYYIGRAVLQFLHIMS